MKLFRPPRFSLRTRFALALSTMLLPLVLLGAGSLLLLHYVIAATEKVVEEAVEEMHPVIHLQTLMLMAAMPPNDYLIHGESAEKGKFAHMDQELDRIFEETLVPSFGLAGEWKLVRDAREEWLQAKALALALLALPRPVGSPAAARDMKRMDGHIYRAVDLLEQVHDIIHRKTDEALARTVAAKRWAYALITGIFIAGIAAVAMVAFALTRSVLLPLQVLGAGVGRFGKGDLFHRVELNKADELGQLAQTFNAMAEKIERHERALEERSSQLNALNQIAISITSLLSIQDILNEIMRRGIALTGAKASCIAFYDEATALFTQWVTQGLSEHFVGNMSFHSGGLADKAFTSGSYILSNDRPETGHKLSRLAREEGLRGFICLPLTSRERRVGVIYFYQTNRDTFTSSEVELLTTFASLAAQAIENARLYAQVQEQARTDALTGQKLNEELEAKVAARTAALDQARLEAEQANRAKSEFLATMSHEIRTPMNGVIGMLDVLQQSSLNGAQIETVNIIRDSAFALLAIIDDILDFSKIEADKLQLENVPMSVADVVEGACETMNHMALQKKVELTLFIDPAIPATVMGDPGRLRQILVNLTNNAIKFSSGQLQGKVSVRALPTKIVPSASGAIESTPTQVVLEFRVTDNGIGMDEASKARLFKPFSQADSSTTRLYGGTGLGLAISYHLVSAMGGEISVQSETGQGSVFNVHLPFKRLADRLDAGEASARHVAIKPDLQNPNLVAGLSCLVVGGTGGLADDLAVYLKHAGARVERVADLAAVKNRIVQQPPGLYIALIDGATDKPPLLDSLRAAVRAHLEHKICFVVIRRGQRREPRLEDTDLVFMDGNVLTRRALLKAVAIAAGRIEQPERQGDANQSKAGTAVAGNVKTALTPMSREEARRQGRLILVAEDNEINQKVIQQQLKLLGQTADIAGNGREALEQWQRGGYGLLLTDLHMPEMDGYELTTAIRAAESDKKRTLIIAITANALKGEAEHCRAVGMDDYLSKPVQLLNLKAMLEKWLPLATKSVPDFHPPLQGEEQSSLPLQGEGQDGGGFDGDGLNQNNSPESLAPIPPPRPLASSPPLKGGELAATASVPVDVNVLKALVGDDEATIRDFLHDFRISAAKIAIELRVACAMDQAATAGALAHKLKSSARSVGALALGELCAEMEKSGKAGDSEVLKVLLPMFEQELANVEDYLERY